MMSTIYFRNLDHSFKEIETECLDIVDIFSLISLIQSKSCVGVQRRSPLLRIFDVILIPTQANNRTTSVTVAVTSVSKLLLVAQALQELIDFSHLNNCRMSSFHWMTTMSILFLYFVYSATILGCISGEEIYILFISEQQQNVESDILLHSSW